MKILRQEIKFIVTIFMIISFFTLVYIMFRKRNKEIKTLNNNIELREKEIQNLQEDKDSLQFLLQYKNYH